MAKIDPRFEKRWLEGRSGTGIQKHITEVEARMGDEKIRMLAPILTYKDGKPVGVNPPMILFGGATFTISRAAFYGILDSADSVKVEIYTADKDKPVMTKEFWADIGSVEVVG